MRIIALMTILLLGIMPAQAQKSSTRDANPIQQTAPKSKPNSKSKSTLKPTSDSAPAASATSAKTPTAKQKPAHARASGASATISQSVRDSYAAIPLSERLAIQSDLIWSGDYNGSVNGEFNDRAIIAVKAFQKRNKTKETGILNPQERGILAAAVKAQQDQVGWRLIDDPFLPGTRLGIPGKLVSQVKQGQSGSRWTSTRGEVLIETFRIDDANGGLPAEFEQHKKNPANRKVEYSVLRPDFFVVSGLQGLKKFYVRAQIKDNNIYGITILYDQAMDGIMEPVVVAMSSAFVPLDAGAMPAKRNVEYSTGIMVSKLGYLLADRQATSGCHTISVVGHGNTERLQEDITANIALLRLHGATEIKPVALALAPPKGSALTLVGIADPQLQDGRDAVTTAQTRLGAVNGSIVGLEPAPMLGFSGSAALDEHGQFIGMVQVRAQSVAGPGPASPPAALVPTATIRKFLEATNVTPIIGRTSIQDVKTSVVRIICIRK